MNEIQSINSKAVRQILDAYGLGEATLLEDGHQLWVFRSIVPTDSGLSCPAIPAHRAHPFRSIAPSLRR